MGADGAMPAVGSGLHQRMRELTPSGLSDQFLAAISSVGFFTTIGGCCAWVEGGR